MFITFLVVLDINTGLCSKLSLWKCDEELELAEGIAHVISNALSQFIQFFNLGAILCDYFLYSICLSDTVFVARYRFVHTCSG